MSDSGNGDHCKVRDFDTGEISYQEGTEARNLSYFLVTKNNFDIIESECLDTNDDGLYIKNSDGELITFSTKLHLALDFLGIPYILGESIWDDFSEPPLYYYRCVKNASLPAIIEKLESLDLEELKKQFDPEEFDVYWVYPDWIWEKDKKEVLFERLMRDYRGVLDLYKKARDFNVHVLMRMFGIDYWGFNSYFWCELRELPDFADDNKYEEAIEVLERIKAWESIPGHKRRLTDNE